jgi:hypothetical protein
MNLTRRQQANPKVPCVVDGCWSERRLPTPATGISCVVNGILVATCLAMNSDVGSTVKFCPSRSAVVMSWSLPKRFGRQLNDANPWLGVRWRLRRAMDQSKPGHFFASALPILI